MNYHRCLNKTGYIISKKHVDAKILENIKKELTVSPIILQAYKDFVKPNEFEIFQESQNYLYLPRFYGIEKFGQPLKNFLSDGIPMNLTFTYSLLPHQIKAYNNTLNALRECGGGVLQIYCGGGKTALAIKIATDLQCKTLVVVNKECLMDQWADSITKFTGGQARIGTLQQSKIDVENKDFVIAMLHSLCKRLYQTTI